VVAEARVFGGAESRVGLVSKGPLELLLPLGSRDMLKAEVHYDGPLPAPVEAGREVGVITVTISEGMTMQAPVYTASDVGVGPLQSRALDGIEELLLGWW
jgi:D-alanyl-D-alanine carboxypeptidase (penicillin-binding protein 5/6)